MTHMEEEATMMMQNLIPVLIFKYGDYVKTYFSQRPWSQQKTTIGMKSLKE